MSPPKNSIFVTDVAKVSTPLGERPVNTLWENRIRPLLNPNIRPRSPSVPVPLSTCPSPVPVSGSPVPSGLNPQGRSLIPSFGPPFCSPTGFRSSSGSFPFRFPVPWFLGPRSRVPVSYVPAAPVFPPAPVSWLKFPVQCSKIESLLCVFPRCPPPNFPRPTPGPLSIPCPKHSTRFGPNPGKEKLGNSPFPIGPFQLFGKGSSNQGNRFPKTFPTQARPRTWVWLT